MEKELINEFLSNKLFYDENQYEIKYRDKNNKLSVSFYEKNSNEELFSIPDISNEKFESIVQLDDSFIVLNNNKCSIRSSENYYALKTINYDNYKEICDLQKVKYKKIGILPTNIKINDELVMQMVNKRVVLTNNVTGESFSYGNYEKIYEYKIPVNNSKLVIFKKRRGEVYGILDVLSNKEYIISEKTYKNLKNSRYDVIEALYLELKDFILDNKEVIDKNNHLIERIQISKQNTFNILNTPKKKNRNVKQNLTPQEIAVKRIQAKEEIRPILDAIHKHQEEEYNNRPKVIRKNNASKQFIEKQTTLYLENIEYYEDAQNLLDEAKKYESIAPTKQYQKIAKDLTRLDASISVREIDATLAYSEKVRAALLDMRDATINNINKKVDSIKKMKIVTEASYVKQYYGQTDSFFNYPNSYQESYDLLIKLVNKLKKNEKVMDRLYYLYIIKVIEKAMEFYEVIPLSYWVNHFDKICEIIELFDFREIVNTKTNLEIKKDIMNITERPLPLNNNVNIMSKCDELYAMLKLLEHFTLNLAGERTLVNTEHAEKLQVKMKESFVKTAEINEKSVDNRLEVIKNYPEFLLSYDHSMYRLVSHDNVVNGDNGIYMTIRLDMINNKYVEPLIIENCYGLIQYGPTEFYVQTKNRYSDITNCHIKALSEHKNMSLINISELSKETDCFASTWSTYTCGNVFSGEREKYNLPSIFSTKDLKTINESYINENYMIIQNALYDIKNSKLYTYKDENSYIKYNVIYKTDFSYQINENVFHPILLAKKINFDNINNPNLYDIIDGITGKAINSNSIIINNIEEDGNVKQLIQKTLKK